MKKTLLSGLMTVFSLAVFAQSPVVIYDGTSNQGVTGTEFYSFKCASCTFTVSEPTTGEGSAVGNDGKFLKLAGSNTGGYYIGGAGNGNYGSGSGNESFGFPETDPEEVQISFSVTTNNTSSNITVQLKNLNGDSFGSEFVLNNDAAVKAGWTTVTKTLDNFGLIVNDAITATPMTAADVKNLTAFQVVLVCTANMGNCSGEANIDNVKLSMVSSAKDASSSISSSNLFPNPSTNLTSVEFNLVEASAVKVVITDMVGKEMDVIFEGNLPAGLRTESFDVSGYNKGTYCVNYYINGKPAKMQMLMVK
ncbi:MAG: T9SS type A sorting domain-containing protein [Cytophagaceae bacterium]